ncbi:excinuclease ABC subunit B, partial [Candidatus Pacearchaeota archaeon]
VVLYADKITKSMREAIAETERRRKIQIEYNKKHGIKPKTIRKPIKEKVTEVKDTKHIPKAQIPNMIIVLEDEMRKAADSLDFERAIVIREKIKELEKRLAINQKAFK